VPIAAGCGEAARSRLSSRRKRTWGSSRARWENSAGEAGGGAG